MITEGKKVFIIAEAGVNHNGQLGMAKRLIDVAVSAGVDAVKFQTFQADRLVVKNAPKARYQKETTGSKETQWSMLKKLELSHKHHVVLQEYCKRKKILFLSTPFDEQSASFLDDIGVPIFKIPSGEITNGPYLKYIAKFMKPVILSTGMANMDEVSQAVSVIQATGNTQISLLHCVSNYPAQAEQVNLKAMDTMAEKFKLPVGYSDHTIGVEISLAAVARGARIIEKHFTLDKRLAGPDHRASLDGEELKILVKGIRSIEKAIGNGIKQPHVSELETAMVVRKSLVAARRIEAGEIINEDMLCIKRPGTGLSPYLKDAIIGRKINCSLKADQLLTKDMFD